MSKKNYVLGQIFTYAGFQIRFYISRVIRILKFLVLLFVFIANKSSESSAQIFGIKTGLNLSNQLIKDDDCTYSDDFKSNLGFHIGATAEFPLTEIFSLETGLQLSTKGFKFSEKETFGDETMEYKALYNLCYFDIPINLKATSNIGKARTYGTFGPYLGIGLFGKGKSEFTYEGEMETNEEKIQWGSDGENDAYKRLDFGFSAGLGLTINSINVGLSYYLGLANISAYTDYGSLINNRVIEISVGYKFGGK